MTFSEFLTASRALVKVHCLVSSDSWPYQAGPGAANGNMNISWDGKTVRIHATNWAAVRLHLEASRPDVHAWFFDLEDRHFQDSSRTPPETQEETERVKEAETSQEIQPPSPSLPPPPPYQAKREGENVVERFAMFKRIMSRK